MGFDGFRMRGIVLVGRYKNGIAFFLACFIALAAILGERGTTVQAAESYKLLNLYSQPQKVGNTTYRYVANGRNGSLYAVQNGRETLLVSVVGLNSTIITNGSTVYYSTSVSNSAVYSSAVYSINSNGGQKKKLFSLNDIMWFVGYYNGKIYYNHGELDEEKFCSYQIKKRKTQTILKDGAGNVRQQGQYFCISPSQGDIWPVLFRVYNAKTGKTKVISKKCLSYSYTVAPKQIYYAEGKYSGSKGYRSIFMVSIKKCSYNGSNRKTLAKNLRVSGIEQINKHSVIYYDENGQKKIKEY